ncbi:SEC14 cytosolic factor family protein/phosphoglyceride transfer family protein [Forsythia ovata]|uniref:SEC14 cytosolic factor family protein/phosphoglyceride transfer family protein n=1 Tax=Forsythia ovata TaxID=205694 RepID=A0ABD1VL93_9LAMI
MTFNTSSSSLSQSQQQKLIQKLEVFKIQGRDKQGHAILRIIGNLFPAKIVNVEALEKYLEDEIFPSLGERPFSVVYVQTWVDRSENLPGISALRSIYESIPVNIRENLKAVYFLHPGFQSRLFLATFGRLLFPGWFYWKLRYINRLEFLWDNIRRKEIEIPEFVYEHDEELEYHRAMDYGLESDHPRVYGVPNLDTTVLTYSMRCLA